jgi:hypothetical protein
VKFNLPSRVRATWGLISPAVLQGIQGMPDFLDMLRFRPVFDVLLRTQGLEVSALTPKKTLEVPDGVCLSSSRMSPTILCKLFRSFGASQSL